MTASLVEMLNSKLFLTVVVVALSAVLSSAQYQPSPECIAANLVSLIM